MTMPALSPVDRKRVLQFAASFLWADLELAEPERRFLGTLARELDVADADGTVEELLASPPEPEEVDPTCVPSRMADTIRHAALRAIAADGSVQDTEMKLFDLLDELLPRGPQPSCEEPL